MTHATILEGIVDKFYVMDPLTEELLMDGTMLREGMFVLIDRTESREEITSELKGSKLDNARYNNRWCWIKNIVIRGEQISFMATYEDHTAKKRVVNVNYPWLVKIHSLPDPQREKYDAVYQLVYQGLMYQDSLTYHQEGTSDSMTKRAGEIADKIVALG
jgi:hypothetical protein